MDYKCVRIYVKFTREKQFIFIVTNNKEIR